MSTITLEGPQPVGTSFFTGLEAMTEVDADGATWSGNPFEFFVLNKIKNSPALIWHGGLIVGSFPASTSWDRMHNAYAFSLDNAPECTLREIRIHNTGDGISIKGASDQAIIYGVHMSYCRDDAVQNDFGTANLTVEECLVDGCYSFFSSRPYAPDVPDHSEVFPTRIEHNLVYLKDMPTVYNKPGPGHAKFFKMDNANQAGWPGHPRDPKLWLINNILRVDTPHVTNTDFMIPPPDRCSESLGNIMVWGGSGEWPYPTAPGWTVTKDVSVWDSAKAQWLADHPGQALELAA